tara:strand:- start:930 stop:1067 length:138 start_codon:yes stop_codon:yes gene_type:complete
MGLIVEIRPAPDGYSSTPAMILDVNIGNEIWSFLPPYLELISEGR